MFNDERINAECGKIYSRGILLTVLVTLLYTISRTITLIIQGEFKTPVTYTEAVILILGIGMLLTGFFRFNKDRDERTVYERHTFYKKAAKRFVIAVFATYILTIPFTTEKMLGGQPHNHLLILLEVLGFLYIFYSFKTKGININYSFIYDDNRNYYRKVFSNVGSLCLWLLLPFAVAATFELVANQSFSGALTILIAYTSSTIGLSAEYVFISMIEKTSYNTVNSTQFALGTKISMTVCLGVELFLAIIQGIYIRLVS
ncbi:MAG: hypothetical protein E7315_06115, partial [Clostridiales bacterium]|nr:hypothetical protein [Clostridiales bacterium]